MLPVLNPVLFWCHVLIFFKDSEKIFNIVITGCLGDLIHLFICLREHLFRFGNPEMGLDGSSFNVLGNYKTALYAIALVEVWKGFGATMIIYLAGLQTVDDSLLEAGRIDGCSQWQLIRKIKLPLISATVTINVILAVIGGLKAFDYSFIMTNGGPGKSTNTLMFSIYRIAFNDQMMGKASAFSVVAFAVIILITVFMLFYMNKREVEL